MAPAPHRLVEASVDGKWGGEPPAVPVVTMKGWSLGEIFLENKQLPIETKR